MAEPKRIALILAGAVAKGAFEAGVLQRLARANVRIVRIVGASSGALGGTLLAAGIRARNAAATADKLVELWTDAAEWNQVFHLSVGDLVRREGISDGKRVLALLRANVRPNPRPPGDAIDLRLVVAPLHGTPGMIGDEPATTFERVLAFSNEAFDSEAGLEPLYTAAAASAALPIAFAPVDVATDALGPCVDGGTVNNTPIKWALAGEVGRSVDAVVIVATTVERIAPDRDPAVRGMQLVSRLFSLLVNERLYRDLRRATRVNAELHALAGLRAELGDAAIDKVLAALSWQHRREVEVVTIRPRTELAGSAFSGFFDRDLRVQYIAEGRAEADRVLASWLGGS